MEPFWSLAVRSRDARLHGAERLFVRTAADDPVEPDLFWFGGAGDEPGLTVGQLGDRSGPATDEVVEPLIAEHAGQVLGVGDQQRYQVEASPDDRAAVVEGAHLAGSLRCGA